MKFSRPKVYLGVAGCGVEVVDVVGVADVVCVGVG